MNYDGTQHQSRVAIENLTAELFMLDLFNDFYVQYSRMFHAMGLYILTVVLCFFLESI